MGVDRRIHWIWLAELLGQGSKLAAKLVNMFGNAEAVYETPTKEILKREELSESERTALKKTLENRDLDRAARILVECESLHVKIALPDSPEYPGSLRALPDMPLVLYYFGNLPNNRERLHISVVGTRKMTPYGRKLAYALGYGLGLGGAVVVSGMALGSDSMATVGALDSNSPVVAVLGGGVDVIYPPEHRDLYYQVIARGAVISEYPPGSPPAGHHFPMRNRIISGLTEGTVVVEGDLRSGSLITARHAAAQGKKIFAVPGKVGETMSEGPLKLLRENAIPVSDASDVLAEFSFLYARTLNLSFARSGVQSMDIEEASKKAMERARIGVRGESNLMGRGSSGGRARDFMKKTPSTERPEEPKEARKTQAPASKPTPPAEVPTTVCETGKRESKTSKNVTPTKNPLEKNEKKRTKSEEKSNYTTGFALNMLDETDWKVYNIMQPNVPLLPDSMVGDDLGISDIMSALSTLELAGIVESTPGGYFVRVGENAPLSLVDDREG